jgi:GT2 family glycosyltransferase
MQGCSGIVLSTNQNDFFYVFFHRISHLGIFKDIRPYVCKKYQKINNKILIRSKSISGGISTWRKDVFEHIQFDKINDFHLLEDIEFSTRVFKFYSNNLYINPAVRLIHNSSPLGRDFDFTKNKRKAKELILFYKKNYNIYFALINTTWLFVCLILQSLINSFKLGQLNANKGLFSGI